MIVSLLHSYRDTQFSLDDDGWMERFQKCVFVSPTLCDCICHSTCTISFTMFMHMSQCYMHIIMCGGCLQKSAPTRHFADFSEYDWDKSRGMVVLQRNGRVCSQLRPLSCDWPFAVFHCPKRIGTPLYCTAQH